MDEWEQEICRNAIKKWGKEKQLNMIIEECAELQKAICKIRRYKNNKELRLKAVEELADVSIVLTQGIMILSNGNEFDRIKVEKLNRLRNIIKEVKPCQNKKKR